MGFSEYLCVISMSCSIHDLIKMLGEVVSGILIVIQASLVRFLVVSSSRYDDQS